jgi:hypothetical protein
LIYCIYIFEFALLDGVVNTIQSNIYEVVLGYF